MKNKIDQYTDTDDEKLFALIEQGLSLIHI